MTYLEELLSQRRSAVDRRKQTRPISDVRAAALLRRERRDFGASLLTGAPAIVAEFKRASPSAGSIDAGANPGATAAAYERGGAAALSVLTEPDRFNGSFEDLGAARSATSLPVLCKDFIVDEYQVWEAVAEGADAVLLIVAALDDERLRSFIEVARDLRVAALVEAHDAEEVQRALTAGSQIIGLNNRDLKTFEVDLTTALRLCAAIPRGTTIVAESGYKTVADVAACSHAGVHAVLVGEALMRDGDPERAVAQLRGLSA